MSRPFVPPDPEAISRIGKMAQRQLTPEEFKAYADAPMEEEEREEIHSLIRWFTRRYPTPAERLSAARRMERSWHGPK